MISIHMLAQKRWGGRIEHARREQMGYFRRRFPLDGVAGRGEAPAGERSRPRSDRAGVPSAPEGATGVREGVRFSENTDTMGVWCPPSPFSVGVRLLPDKTLAGVPRGDAAASTDAGVLRGDGVTMPTMAER